jgi:hypothetical protein
MAENWYVGFIRGADNYGEISMSWSPTKGPCINNELRSLGGGGVGRTWRVML